MVLEITRIDLAVLRCLNTEKMVIGEKLRVGVAHFFILYKINFTFPSEWIPPLS